MDRNFGKKIDSPNRGRGHSFLSVLKGAGHHEDGSGRGHPGIPISRLRKGAGQDAVKVTEDLSACDYGTPEPGVSALTMALEGMAITGNQPIPIIPAVPVPISGNSLNMRKIAEAKKNAALVTIQANDDLRNWCSGQPAKKSFLGSDAGHAIRSPLSRRSTLAEKPELDDLLAATKVEYDGHEYLPLTEHTVHRLSPFYKGEKPIADLNLFKSVIITPEINGVHADHVVAAMERIGIYCEQLLVLAPIQTSELGNVFNREAGNIAPGNDWDHILALFPNIKHLAFMHPLHEPIQLSRGTFSALHSAVGRCQVTHNIKSFKYDGPVQLFVTGPYVQMAQTSTPT